MNINIRIFLIIIFLAIFGNFISGQVKTDGDAVIGKWFTAENKSIIRIYREKDNKYYGKVIWLKVPNENGRPKTDNNNPDKNLRNQPRLGLVVLKGFVYDGNNHWSGGTVYDPEEGKTYDSKMKLTTPDQLDLRGYIGISLIGRTTTWYRGKL